MLASNGRGLPAAPTGLLRPARYRPRPGSPPNRRSCGRRTSARGGQVDEGRGAHVIAVRVGLAVGDDDRSPARPSALRRANRPRPPARSPGTASCRRHDRPFGQSARSACFRMRRLWRISPCGRRKRSYTSPSGRRAHVELEAVVDRVGVGPADVIGHARGAQHRAGHAEYAIACSRGQHADALGSGDERSRCRSDSASSSSISAGRRFADQLARLLDPACRAGRRATPPKRM